MSDVLAADVRAEAEGAGRRSRRRDGSGRGPSGPVRDGWRGCSDRPGRGPTDQRTPACVVWRSWRRSTVMRCVRMAWAAGRCRGRQETRLQCAAPRLSSSVYNAKVSRKESAGTSSAASHATKRSPGTSPTPGIRPGGTACGADSRVDQVAVSIRADPNPSHLRCGQSLGLPRVRPVRSGRKRQAAAPSIRGAAGPPIKRPGGDGCCDGCLSR